MKWNELEIKWTWNEMNAWEMHQSINQSIKQAINQSNQSMNQWINDSLNQWMNELRLPWATNSLSQVFSKLHFHWATSSLSYFFCSFCNPILLFARRWGWHDDVVDMMVWSPTMTVVRNTEVCWRSFLWQDMEVSWKSISTPSHHPFE